jgi:stage V sporulation protein T
MTQTHNIAGYCRISVDEELDRDNVSIENQKAIIEDFAERTFPGSPLTFYEDRDRSGYTFEQRENYQTMRRGLMEHRYDILIVKDFSRFSRRNSRGLVELEDLRDAGARIISIGDDVDFPNDDDWLKIQLQFLLNEMPVTDTSKKVKSVIRRRQEDAKWICAAPYGYIVNRQQQFEIVPTEADIVRRIFSLYLGGWGYKKIANWLTDEGIPTPRMSERERREREGAPCRRQAKAAWAIVTVQGILDNDFYIGTLRQGKYTRKKINGKDRKRDAGEQLVFENHHQAVIDYRTFATAKALREKRTSSSYRGVKVNDNIYSGFLFCGDCGSPMFAMSRRDLKDAYRCGTYHRRGLKGCTSHHIRVDRLDEALREYVRRVQENSAAMLARLNADLAKEDEDVGEAETAAENLTAVLGDLQEELKATKRARIRDIMKHPEQEQTLEATYGELEDDLVRRMEGLQSQIDMTENRRNTIIEVNRAAKTAMAAFDDILRKPKLERNDLELIIERITVFEDHIDVQLKPDVDAILRSGTLNASSAAALPTDDKGNSPWEFEITQSSTHHGEKVYHVRVVSNGDPLEIYTEKDGEVIFKKYSPMGDLAELAAQICESIGKNTGHIAAVADRDTVIAVSGAPRRDLMDKRSSQELERLMEARKAYRFQEGGSRLRVSDTVEQYHVGAAAPILSEGDLMGCVLLLLEEGDAPMGEGELRLVQTIAGFLGRQMES